MVDFRVTSQKNGGRGFPVQAIVLHKVTSDLSSSPTPFNDKWKHLQGLELADPDFRTPEAIDLLLVTEIFSQAVLHRRRFGPRRLPMVLKTHFGWVLSGAVISKQQQGLDSCCLVTKSADDSESRGLYPQEFADHGLWWKGPSWLLQPASHSPATPTSLGRLAWTFGGEGVFWRARACFAGHHDWLPPARANF